MSVIRNKKEIEIVLTNKCNLKCQHCFNVKDSLEMSKETLDLANNHICKYIKKNSGKEFHIQYMGGEVGLYNQNLISDSIDYIKENIVDENIKFTIQSNLVYKLTDAHKNLINKLDSVNTSYDYDIRFDNGNKKVIFFNNLKYIQSLNKQIQVTFTLTNIFIKHMTPTLFWDFIIASDIHEISFNCFIPTNEISKILLPKCEDVREWYYKTFLLYEEIRNYYNVRIEEFENTRDSFHGKQEFIHARSCTLDIIGILPNGNIITCPLRTDMPIYNLITKENKYSLEEVNKTEQSLNENCKQCKYFKYCNGFCHLYPFDETGCTMPYKIYDYLETLKSIENDY